jgi:Flp pilus assembly protein TadD
VSGGRATALAVAAAFVALLPAWQAGFVHDDGPQILANPWVRDLAHLPKLWTTSVWSGVGGDSSWYRPAMMTSFALDHAVFGFSAPAFHAVSLALFFALVAGVVRAVLAFGGGPAAAAAAGVLVAVHPANVESAVWISARGDLIAGVGGLAALLAHERARTAGDAAPRWRAAVAAALGFGLLGKENAAAVWPVLWAADLARGERFGPVDLARRHTGPALALAVYLGLRAAAIGSVEGGLGGGVAPAAWLAALGQGAARLVWPVGLSMAPPVPTAAHVGIGAAALLVGAAGLAIAVRRRAVWLVPWTLAGAQLAVAALAATRTGELADRYLLLPSVGLAWCAGLAVLGPRPAAATRRRVAVACVAGLALALGAASFARARVFRDDATLWRDAWRRNPASVRAAVNLGTVALGEGRPQEALAWMDRAEALSPGDRDVALNRAAAYAELGRADEARAQLEGWLAAHPGDAGALLRLGHLALDADDPREAARHYRAVVARMPWEAEAWAGLGVALARRGDRAGARDALERALALDPDVQNAAALRGLLDRLAR